MSDSYTVSADITLKPENIDYTQRPEIRFQTVKKQQQNFQYLFVDPEKVEHHPPESKPLLTGGASADPEKPPYDPSVDTNQ